MLSIPKLLVFALIIGVIYFMFFKKKKESSSEEQTMVECSKCGVFVSSKDAFVKDGKFYCSKECMKDS